MNFFRYPYIACTLLALVFVITLLVLLGVRLVSLWWLVDA